MQGTVIVFDFDETIIDCDSDQWIARDIGAADFFNNLLKSMSWNSASIRMMREFHSQGRSIDEITKSLKKIPLSPHIVATIKSAHALGCELSVLSDANTFFIETVLKHHGISDFFSEICTNPSFVDGEGKLIISPYHDIDNSTCPHSCTLCPPNMCKGIIIGKKRELACSMGKKRIIYVGDGKGDYCPSLRLGKGCIIMPRTNYPLWKLLHDNTKDIEAKIHEWGDYFELESVLLGLLEPVSNSDSGSVNNNNDCVMTLISPDCKSDAMPPEFLISRV